ncbi:MAG: hypothetical protein H0X41_05335 [Chitinophagaceae bacterium]|nr:hypothetical protein [Chitinophagaceae bacterium]
MIRLMLTLVAILLISTSPAQSVGGSWYGKADVLVKGNSSNYLTELIIKQKADEVEGIFGYYFKDVYQSFFIHGTYNKKTRQVDIRNLPMLFYASTTKNGIECPMRFQGTLMVSKVNSTLKGSFYTDPKYKYTCPEMRVNMIMDTNVNNQDSMLRNSVAGRKFWKPREEDVVINANKPDTASTDTLSSIKSSASKSLPVENKSLEAEFGKRNNIYEKDIIVHDDSILVSFYDNGDIDDDTISVFLNKKPVLVRRGLTSRALNIYIGLDSTIDINELSMFADNLGKYPPNTALMVISDGTSRYELYLSASLKQNASVRLRRGVRR